jgi:cytochrome bd-type quinol oxidase subunit 1
MSDLLAARSQMAISLAFHIIFAVVGIGMPLLMVLAELRWQATRDPVYLGWLADGQGHRDSVRGRSGSGTVLS